MAGRDSEFDTSPESGVSQTPPIILRSPPNWTAVIFFGSLGMLHLSMAAMSAFQQQWGYPMSAIFGTMFLTVAVAFLLIRHEVAIMPGRRRVLVRNRLGRIAFHRAIPFAKVQCVRVTLLNSRGRHESTVTVVCEEEELEIPPHERPRHLALLLAMTMSVRLVKIYGDDVPSAPSQRIANLLESDQGNSN